MTETTKYYDMEPLIKEAIENECYDVLMMLYCDCWTPRHSVEEYREWIFSDEFEREILEYETFPEEYPGHYRDFDDNDLRFNSSWNWMMFFIKKVKKENGDEQLSKVLIKSIESLNINWVYEKACNFIIWYFKEKHVVE